MRLFHEKQGILRLQEAVKERKKMCLEWQLVEWTCTDCIQDVFFPLPVILKMASSSSIHDNSAWQQSSVFLMFTLPQDEKNADNNEGGKKELYSMPKPKTPTYSPSFDALDNVHNILWSPSSFPLPKSLSEAPLSEYLDDCTMSVQLLQAHRTIRRIDCPGSQKQDSKRAKNMILNCFSASQNWMLVEP